MRSSFLVMDAFVKIYKQKKKESITLHHKETERLKKYISQGKNVMICGAHGFGKSFILNEVLDESNSIEMPYNYKVSDELKGSNMCIFLEDYRHDVVAQRQIIDYVSDGGTISKSSFIVTSKNVFLLPNFELIIVPKRTPAEIATLRPNEPGAYSAAVKCKGNIYNFFDYINFSDEKDLFTDPKDIAKSLLCKEESDDNINTLHEHGHVWGMIHENYVDSDGVDVTRISHALSDADLYDSSIYDGNWDSMTYFINSVYNVPKHYLGGPVDEKNIRPGSFWTKYGNYKMRYQKYTNIGLRTRMSHQELGLLREYARIGDIEKYLSCGLTTQDFDVINHLCVGNKLKAREVSQIKKKIKELKT